MTSKLCVHCRHLAIHIQITILLYFICFTLLVSKVKNLLETICVADICQGNPDERF